MSATSTQNANRTRRMQALASIMSHAFGPRLAYLGFRRFFSCTLLESLISHCRFPHAHFYDPT